MADVKGIARSLLADGPGVSSGELARAAGISRQAAHYHLVRMVRSGELERRGAGRGARYVKAADLARTYQLAGLEEDRVWREVVGALPVLDRPRPNVRSIVSYAFTEMLNNAIEHSTGRKVEVTVWARPDAIAFEIVDDGVGAFRNVRERFRLPDELAAIQELSKGKETTAPDRHSGEGIFFTSKAVDRFVLESGQLRWVVDNRRHDQAVGDAPPRRGTRVRCEIDTRSDRTLADVFRAYTDEETLEFGRSSVTVRLFETHGDFVSRSEAKRLASRLEGFREVVLDFSGVTEVGQGFVDELFRVWGHQHADTRLVPHNMSPAVAWMVRRASTPD